MPAVSSATVSLRSAIRTMGDPAALVASAHRLTIRSTGVLTSGRMWARGSGRPVGGGTPPGLLEPRHLEPGEFDALFATAERHEVPVFAWVPGRAHLLLPYVQRFSEVRFIVDHCGVGVAPLSEEDYPYRDVMPLLWQAIDALGVERIMWASDYTIARDQNGNSWGGCLYYMLDSDQLSWTEKEWLIGSSARQVLRWTD
jgi:hypothetical protein